MSTPASLPTVKGFGPPNASIMIVADCTTADDLWKSHPLAGSQGDFFSKLLHEAGIIRSECYVTNAWKSRPPEDNIRKLFTQTKSTAQKTGLSSVVGDTWVHPSVPAAIAVLHEEIAHVNPATIIALGDFAMFACTGVYGSVDTWRGSHLECSAPSTNITVIPTYPPASIYKQWGIKGFCVRDLQRARDAARRPELYIYPTYTFHIRPVFSLVRDTLAALLTQVSSGKELALACDIETIARHISCIGIAWSSRESLCIPFMSLEGHYWSEEEEIEIQFLLRALLTHPLCEVIGQNFNYDNQHFAKHLGYLPNLTFDTMIAQHVLFPGIPKALDFLSSMYCHWHRYWKDEMNDYSRLPENMEQYWTYNCKDCVTTYEIALVLKQLLEHLQRVPQFDFMLETSKSALQSMLRGMRIDAKTRSEVAGKLLEAIAEYDALIQDIVGFPLNAGSPQQMAKFLYDELKLPIQVDKKTRRPTTGAKALEVLSQKEPIVKPLLELIARKRQLGVFLSTFCLMPLDSDGRMRCSFNVCGTETMRFSSSENAFGNGGNLQNIPKGEKE
jgi:uracil-DNA glycosylase